MTLYSRVVTRGCVVAIALLGAVALQAQAQPLTIGSYTVVAERRVAPGVSDYELRAVISNGGATPLPVVYGSLVSLRKSARVMDGSLRFDNVPARGTKVSTDTFVIRKARGVRLDTSDVVWSTSLGGDLVIDGYRLVGVRRVDHLVSDFEYRAHVVNKGGSVVEGVVATLVSAGRAGIRDGQLSFGRVGPGQRRRSLDTFTLRRSRHLPIVPEGLSWQFVANAPTANRPPTAVVGAVPPPRVAQVVTLDGSASSDPDGDALTYAWTVVTRPSGSAAVVQNATNAVTTFTPDRPGSYEIQLAVSDGALMDAEPAAFTTVNTAPIANASTPQTVVAGATVTLDGSGSFDVDGDALTFAWTVQTRPAGSVSKLSAPAAVMPTFLIDAAGTYAFRLVVQDSRGASSQPSMVTVSTVNSPPVADAGPDQTVTGGLLVTLTGSASSDVDGDALSFVWAFAQRPAGSAAVLASPGSVAPSFVADRSGTFIVRLTVTDPSGANSSDTVSVTTANTPPVANAGPDQSVFVGNTVRLDGVGSTDVDGDTLTYSWSFTAQPQFSTVALSANGVPAPTFVVDRPGTYIAQLLVTDGAGGSDIDTVVITTQNSRPTANAGADQPAAIGQPVTLDGRGSSDPDFDPLTYDWALLTAPSQSRATLVNPTSAQPTFVTDLIGTYVVQLIVNDGALLSVADTVTITTANTPPVANAGDDPGRVALGQVDLDGGLSSDADGHPLTYAWSFLSRPPQSAADLGNADTRTPFFTPDVGGDYVVQLIVNDGFTNSAPDTVLVRVNTPPTGSASGSPSGTVGVPVQLTGSAFDADGDPVGYVWMLGAPAGSGAMLSSGFAQNPTFTPDVAGTYVASLFLTDGYNLVAVGDVTITVP